MFFYQKSMHTECIFFSISDYDLCKMLIFHAITKKLIIFPLFTPHFPLKIYNCRGTFFEKGKEGGGGCGGAQLTKANVSWVGTGERGGRGRVGGFFQKLETFTGNTYSTPGSRKKRTLLVMLSSFLIHNSSNLSRDLHITSNYRRPRRFYF